MTISISEKDAKAISSCNRQAGWAIIWLVATVVGAFYYLPILDYAFKPTDSLNTLATYVGTVSTFWTLIGIFKGLSSQTLKAKEIWVKVHNHGFNGLVFSYFLLMGWYIPAAVLAVLVMIFLSLMVIAELD